MKILLLNGSTNEKGSTYTVLDYVSKLFKERHIESEIFWVGNNSIYDCNACQMCSKTGKCIYNDRVNMFVEKANKCDGFIVASPVFYSGITGQLKSFLDRAFYSNSRNKSRNAFAFKPSAGIVCPRHAGGSFALEEINKYFLCSSMLVVCSNYWNIVYGKNPTEILKDDEGTKNLQTLVNNMVFYLQILESSKSEIPLHFSN